MQQVVRGSVYSNHTQLSIHAAEGGSALPICLTFKLFIVLPRDSASLRSGARVYCCQSAGKLNHHCSECHMTTHVARCEL